MAAHPGRCNRKAEPRIAQSLDHNAARGDKGQCIAG
jgi:hypothetical protein